MSEQLTRRFDNVRVEAFEGLLVDFAMQKKAGAIMRGIRAISDYEYELQMAWMNRKLHPQVETVFMMPAEAYSYLSSTADQRNFPARRLGARTGSGAGGAAAGRKIQCSSHCNVNLKK